MLAGVAALAIFIGGCGDGGSADTTAGAELTRAQILARADATCGKQNEELSQHFEEFSVANPIKNGEPTEAQSKEFSEEFFFPYVEDRIEVLEELDLPAGDEKEIVAIIAATEDGVERGKQKLDSGNISSDDPLAKAEAMSRKFGFAVCGET